MMVRIHYNADKSPSQVAENNAQRQRIRAPDLSGSICRGILRRRSGRDPPLIYAAIVPELPGSLGRVDAGILPPGGFIADAVHQPMMNAAERHRELVARLAAQCPRLDGGLGAFGRQERDSRSSKATSNSLASAAVSWFLAAGARCAQSVALSSDGRVAIPPKSRSRRAAD